MPAIPSWLLEPLWDQFAALLPDRPVYHPSHPLGCHQPRIADRIIFEKLIQVLRFGCSYASIADCACGAPRSGNAATSGSMNWRGRPLTSHEVIVSLIASTRTRTGLTVAAELDQAEYPKGIKISDQEMADLEQSRRLRRHGFHGEWNLCPVAHRFHYAGAGIMGRGMVDRGNVAESEGIWTA